MGSIDLLVLSPHYDDAALSCGGEIARCTASGQRVVVVNIFSEPPSDGDLSDFAVEHLERWRRSAGAPRDLAEHVVDVRRAEDQAALERLGAESIRLGLPDAIFRRAGGTDHPYRTLESLFGPIDPREASLAAVVAGRLAEVPEVGRRTRILAPLGVGGHVDHRLARAAAEEWRDIAGVDIAYYADLPYAADPPVGRPADPPQSTRYDPRHDRETDPSHDPGFDPRSDPRLDPRLTPYLVPLEVQDVEAKIEAVREYSSQISTFWENEGAMAADVRRWARARAIDPRLPAGTLGEWRYAARGNGSEAFEP